MMIDEFNKTIDVWIAILEQLNLEQLRAKPDAASWSLGQVFRHLIDDTNYFVEQIDLCLCHDENPDGEMHENARVMFLNNTFPDAIIKGNPDASTNLPQPQSKQQLQDEIQKLKWRANDVWQKSNHTTSKGKTRHPGLGYFNAYEWLQFAEMHLRHHLRQKKRITDALTAKGIVF